MCEPERYFWFAHRASSLATGKTASATLMGVLAGYSAATYHFSLDYHNATHPAVAALADECNQRYDLFFLCGTDIPYNDTWDRSGDVHRDRFQQKLEADLLARGTPFVRLTGSLEQRAEQVNQILRDFNSFTS